MKLQERIQKELQRFIKRVQALFDLKPAQDTPQPPETQNTPPTGQGIAGSQEQQQSTIDIEVTIHSFGSPNCSKAQEDPNTQIKDLTISDKGLSYGWAKGNLRNWGIQDDHAARALAIMGYSQNNKAYRCAKADWISSDRLTRSFENIDEGYNGFNGKEFRAAPYKCFFIMSADGKKRTNVICTFKPMK